MTQKKAKPAPQSFGEKMMGPRLNLDDLKIDYHEVCYYCRSEDLPENPWMAFKKDGVTGAPICDKCANRNEVLEKDLGTT